MKDLPPRFHSPYYVSVLLASQKLEHLLAGGKQGYSEEVVQTLQLLILNAEALLSSIGKQEKFEKTPQS